MIRALANLLTGFDFGRRPVLALPLLCFLLAWSAHVSHAATINLDANCNLGEAIKSANGDSTPSGSTCEAGSGADTIVFGTITQVTLLAAFDNIISDITIQGGTNVSIDGASYYRHFIITGGGKLTLKNIILNNGKTSQDGGSIYVASGGRLTLTEVTVGNAEAGRNGGGIFIASGATATIQGKRIHDNDAVNGGDIYSLGSLTLIDSTLESNKAKTIGSATGKHGGGIYIAGGSATVRGGSIIKSSTAVENGAGIYITSGSVTISNSSIFNNVATKDGGGIYVGTGGRLTISNSTVAKNTAKIQGGGILYAAGGSSSITHVTIMENVVNDASTSTATGLHVSHQESAKNLRLRNSIIASSDSDNADCYSSREIGQYVGNLVRQQQCWAAANGDPNLDTTTNAPEYYTPNSGSPALGIGNASICRQYSLDQLGVRRPATGCDAGSVERGGENWINVDSDCTLNDAIRAANTNAAVSNSGCEAGKSGAQDVIWLRRNVRLSANLPNVTESVRIEGGGRAIDGVGGNAIFGMTGSYTLTLKNMTLKNGKHGNGGGAFRISGGTVNATNIVFDSNATDGNGGAVYQSNGTVNIDRSLFKANTAASYGGAIEVQQGTLTLTNSTLVDNRSGNHGGAIYISGGTATLAHLTLWNNRNTHDGGDWVDNIRAGGTTNMYNTIIGRDSVTTHKLCGGGFNDSTTARGILIFNGLKDADGNNADGCPAATDANPRLRGLSGGVLPLGAGSPAIGAGRPATCTEYPTDQRGAARSLNNCDIGAVQFFQVEEAGGGPYIPPTPIACTGEWLNANSDIRVSATYDICSGINFERRDFGAIGIQWVIDAGPLDVVDVWGWVRPTAEVCFPQLGSMLSISASMGQRVVQPLPSYRDGQYSCAQIGEPALLVLLQADSPHTTAPSAGPQVELAGCMVRTKYILNLREAADGDVITLLPYDVTLTAFSQAGLWYEVDYHGTRGWVSGAYVEPMGNCG